MITRLTAGFIVSAFAIVVVVAVLMRRDANAYPYTFDWPGQQYIADANGNYAYRDLTFSWDYWQSSGGYAYTSVYPVASYVRIASPSTGWHYDSWGLWMMWQCSFPYGGPDNFYGTSSWSATFSNTPQTVSVATWDFPCGNTNVRFGMCQGPDCAYWPFGMVMSVRGGWLEAALAAWGTSASAWNYQN